jgi:hypothetical protein
MKKSMFLRLCDNKHINAIHHHWVMSVFLAFAHLSANADDGGGLSVGPVEIGGAFRVNYIYKDWDEAFGNTGEFALDTARINLDLEDDVLTGSFEYRYYRDKHAGGHDYFVLHDAWIGAKITQQQQLQAGVHKVPFGILPYASHNWFFQLGYYVGLEDDYDLGIKYLWESDVWNIQTAWFSRAENSSSTGQSVDSARYSYDLVREGTNGNRERDQFNIRLTRTLVHSGDRKTEIGLSLQHGTVPNSNTDLDGDQSAIALHLNANWGRWNLMLQGVNYKYDVRNDPVADASPDGSFVVMGAYDAAYNVASDGALYSVGVAYSLPVSLVWITNLIFYNDYSWLRKDNVSFSDTRQNVLGMAITAGKFYVYVDIASGRNHPWLGGDWVNGLAVGDAGDGWHTRFNINVGYYF